MPQRYRGIDAAAAGEASTEAEHTKPRRLDFNHIAIDIPDSPEVRSTRAGGAAMLPALQRERRWV